VTQGQRVGEAPLWRRVIIGNLLWFTGSVVLAFLVWMIAITQADPFEQWRMAERVPIRLTPDSGLIITNLEEITTSASLRLRAQRSMRSLIAVDDILVWADMAGLGPGEYTLPLQYRIAPERRAAVVDISPRQITVRLELEQARLVPVNEELVSDPALAYSIEAIVFDERQITVSGPESRVSQVVEAHVPLDLAGMRVAFEDDIRPIPVDADGNPVDGVTLEPSSVHVSVNIQPRSDVREVRVQPNIVGELPEGYVLTGTFDYDPQVVVVSGPAALLATMPGTVFTAPIDLSQRTSSFAVDVPLELPDTRLVPLTGGFIHVSVGIDTQMTTRQFDQLPVEIIGERAGLDYRLATEAVTVLITGAQPIVEALLPQDVSVIVDVSGLTAPGTYQLSLGASIGRGQSAVTIALLPDGIDVEILPEVTPETTP
jgi:YbbR domain-containing protein